jgi:hypothetical protein
MTQHSEKEVTVHDDKSGSLLYFQPGRQVSAGDYESDSFFET